jgi:hypothetical protein
MRCPICGANIEVSEVDGMTLIRQDCKCKIDVVKSSQLGFEVPEVEPEEDN